MNKILDFFSSKENFERKKKVFSKISFLLTWHETLGVRKMTHEMKQLAFGIKVKLDPIFLK